jgi:hypothetical protein
MSDHTHQFDMDSIRSKYRIRKDPYQGWTLNDGYQIQYYYSIQIKGLFGWRLFEEGVTHSTYDDAVRYLHNYLISKQYPPAIEYLPVDFTKLN